jgi:hypothetical protein
MFEVGVEGLNQTVTCDLPGCVVQPMATFVKNYSNLGRYFMHGLRPAYSDICDPLPEPVRCPQCTCCFSYLYGVRLTGRTSELILIHVNQSST